MSTKNISLTKIPLNYDGAAVAVTLVTAADTGAVDYTKNDGKTIIFLRNTGSSSVTTTFLKGTGLQAVNDMQIEVKAGEVRLVNLESGKFKQTAGENKGKVLFSVSASMLEAAAFLLP